MLITGICGNYQSTTGLHYSPVFESVNIPGQLETSTVLSTLSVVIKSFVKIPSKLVFHASRFTADLSFQSNKTEQLIDPFGNFQRTRKIKFS